MVTELEWMGVRVCMHMYVWLWGSEHCPHFVILVQNTGCFLWRDSTVTLEVSVKYSVHQS